MRRGAGAIRGVIASMALVTGMLGAGSTAGAQTSQPPLYETVNGPKTEDQVKTELTAASYPGPWTLTDELRAYNLYGRQSPLFTSSATQAGLQVTLSAPGTGLKLNGIDATWTVPSVTPGPDPSSAVLIEAGLVGNAGIGLLAGTADSGQGPIAWVRGAGDRDITQVPLQVNVGDAVEVQFTFIAHTLFTVMFTDLASGQSYQQSMSVGFDSGYAAVCGVGTAPSGSLATFGTVSFGKCGETVAGQAPPTTRTSVVSVVMVQRSDHNRVLAAPSNAAPGGSFTLAQY